MLLLGQFEWSCIDSVTPRRESKNFVPIVIRYVYGGDKHGY